MCSLLLHRYRVMSLLFYLTFNNLTCLSEYLTMSSSISSADETSLGVAYVSVLN